MIVKTTPSYIRLVVDGKTVTVEGEAAGMGAGQRPYFVAYSNSIHHWDSVSGGEVIDEPTKKLILKVLEQDCRARNFPLEIE